jgi:hypothetical protein
MKKVFTLIFMVFALNTVQSQTYYPLVIPNSSWNEVEKHSPNGLEHQYFYYESYIYDTVTEVINQKRYHIIWASTNYAYIREDSTKKVYFYQPQPNSNIVDTSEILLYDFNMHIGDTLLTRVYYNGIYECKNVVTDIDSVLVNGEYRKRFKVSRNGYNAQFYWIEGIGSSMGLLGNWIMPFEADYELICYKVYDTLYFKVPKFASCNGYLSVVKIMPVSPKIYPNPAADFLQIENISDKTNIEIFSIDGKLQKSLTISENGNVKINELAGGIYIIKLQTEKGLIYRKFIKQ